MSKADLTVERLRELLDYDPETGVLTWRTRTSNRVVKGAPAGWNACGYVHVGVEGRNYLAHRLIWLHVYGSWPKHGVDHIDGNRSNNRLSNLRDIPQATNTENRRTSKPGNKAGRLGVAPSRKRWSAQIHLRGKKHHLGIFDTPEQAHQVYLEAKRRLHEGCTL